MSTLLRRSGQIARLSRPNLRVAQAASRSPFAVRRRLPVPQCIYAQQHSRLFATGPPEEPKDKKQDEVAKDKQGQAGKPASENAESRSNTSKLSEEEEKLLDQLVSFVSMGVPKAQKQAMQDAVNEIKKTGIPKELREEMEKLQRGEKLDLATAAKISRLTTKFARKTAEEQLKASSEQPQQKSGAHDPGPGQPQGEKKKSKQDKGGPQFGAPQTMDWNTTLITAFLAWLTYRMVMPGENTKEITWQEFRTTFLDKGLVEKIVILNGNRAKVHLHREAVASMYPDSPAASQNFYYYFTIGSVESFERKMEDAQYELQIPSHDRIPCLLYTSPSPRDGLLSRMPSSA